MAHYRLRACGCAVVVLLAAVAVSQSGAQDKSLPFAGPKPPEELQVLAPLVGQWTSKLEIRPSLQDKEGVSATGQLTGQWLHNRHFIRVEGTTAAQYRGESTNLYTYDAKKKVYRRWLFTSSGLATESEGKWDEANHTMTWKTLNLSPNVAGGITDVITKDRIEVTVLFKRDDGQVLTDVTLIATKKP